MLALRASSKPQELEMLAKRPQKRLHEAPKRCQMALRRPKNRPRGVQEASGGPFEPLQSPRSRKNDPRTSFFRASSKPQGSKTVAQGRFASLFEQWSKQRSKRLRSSATPPRKMLEEAVEAAVEDASKLLRSRWPRSGLAGSDFARSRSATTRGQ